MDIKEYIENIPMWSNKKNSLKSIREFLANMDIKNNKKIPIIHIAGTNGKGSLCAYTSQILIDMGYRVGTFISPHLVEINERICINMIPISDEEFGYLAEFVREKTNLLAEKNFVRPTYFEFLFYMAMKCFFESELDFIILETGLGGLYDITNAIEEKDLCIITSISKDHEKYLGTSIEEIVSQKLGILRKNAKLVYDDTSLQVKKEIEKQILKYKLKKALPLSDFNKYIQDFEPEIELEGLNAAYKFRNAALSILAIKELYDSAYLKEFSLAQIRKSILSTTWQGRMQEIQKGIYIDGAHNEDGILEFTKTCKSICEKENKKALILLSSVADKDMLSMFKNFKNIEKYISKIYISKMDNDRAASIEEIKKNLTRYIDVEFVAKKSIKLAFDTMLKDKKEDDLCFCIGSLYMIGEILKYEKGQVNAKF